MKIDLERLKQDVMELAGIGRDEEYGINRQAFSPADLEAREWFQERIRAAGLEPRMDGAGNISARLGSGEGPVLLLGSHLDTVPNAGHLDGTLGVLVGLECVRVLKENKVPLKQDVEVISFSDEEGRFGGLFGSQALVGDLTPESILQATDLEGVKLADILRDLGMEPLEALDARRDPAQLRGYLELHIEQGPVLDQLGHEVGVVTGITGLFKWLVTLRGSPNHAGTTPMSMRHDAFLGLSEFALQIPRILEENGGEESRATIGKVDLVPGVANTVPGRVDFALDVRDPEPEVLEELGLAFRKALSAIARRRGLRFDFEVVSEVAPAACDRELVEHLIQTAQELELNYRQLPSGAVHDAQIVSRIAPVGMIFVPSKDGQSHSPAEWTAWEHVEGGANLMLNTIPRIAAPTT